MYVAKNLEEIAVLFEERAERAKKMAKQVGKREAQILDREYSTWQQAANVLRNTKLEEKPDD